MLGWFAGSTEVLSTSLEKTFLVARWLRTRTWTGDSRHKDNPGFYSVPFLDFQRLKSFLEVTDTNVFLAMGHLCEKDDGGPNIMNTAPTSSHCSRFVPNDCEDCP